jgi:hypothetical protein
MPRITWICLSLGVLAGCGAPSPRPAGAPTVSVSAALTKPGTPDGIEVRITTGPTAVRLENTVRLYRFTDGAWALLRSSSPIALEAVGPLGITDPAQKCIPVAADGVFVIGPSTADLLPRYHTGPPGPMPGRYRVAVRSCDLTQSYDSNEITL